MRSSRKWPIHTRAISLIRAVAWPGVRGGPPIDLLAPRPLLSQEYITFHSLFLLSEEPDITQGQKAERSHPNKTHLSAGRLMLLSVGIKARGQLSSSTIRKASSATGDVWGFWVICGNGLERWGGDDSYRPCFNMPHSPPDFRHARRYYNIQITVHCKLIGLINIQVNDDTVNTFH